MSKLKKLGKKALYIYLCYNIVMLVVVLITAPTIFTDAIDLGTQIGNNITGEN